jgi:anti-sigma factor RsiW
MNKVIHSIDPEELMAYLDGELPAGRAATTAAHLGECAECQSLVAELRVVSQDLRTWRVDVPVSAMTPAIVAAVANRGLASRRILPVRQTLRERLGLHWPAVAWVGAVASVLLLTFGIPTLHRLPSSNVYRNAGQAIQADGRPVPAPPSAAPVNGRQFDRLEQVGKLQDAPIPPPPPPPPLASAALQTEQSAAQHDVPANGPMIIRTARLSLITKEFDRARANLEAILKRHRGFIGELNAGGNTGNGRTLTATLRVPADQLDATMAEVKALGRVESESQGGQDVTSQYVDLQARLGNSRNTEERLTDLLRNRTGKLSDVLEVEQELSRVRGEIEEMEAERKTMANQVSYATLNATITEDYKAELQVVPPSTSTRLGNAAIEGYRSMVDGVVSLALFLLSTGPSLLLWAAVLFLPGRLIWKKMRRSVAN